MNKRVEHVKSLNDSRNGAAGKKGAEKGRKVRFGIGTQILLCFLIPVAFVIAVGVQAYQSAASGMSRKFEESTLETLKMTMEYVELGCEFISAEGMKYGFNDNLSKYYLGLYEEDAVKKSSVMTDSREMMSTAKLANDFINNIHVITKEELYLLTTKTASNKTATMGFYRELDEAFKEKYGQEKIPSWIDSHELVDEKLALNPEETILSYICQSNGNTAFVIIDMKKQAVKDILSKLRLGEGSVVGLVTSGGTECVIGSEENGFFTALEAYQKGAASEDTAGVIGTEYNGEAYLYLYDRSENGVFTVCALVPESIVTSQADSIKSLTVIMVVLACIAAAGIGIIISLRIGSSMKRIMKSMSAVSDGDLTVTVKTKGRDEFSLLARSMNEMVHHTKSLVQKAAEATGNLENSTEAVATSSRVINEYSENITGAIGEIHSGMNVQSENAQECLQKTDMLSEDIRMISEKVEEVELLVQSTGRTIEEGIKSMAVLGERAGATTYMTNKVEGSINLLQEEFKQIQLFVETIDSISEETNLLSLNASIEAARAGDSGRGFSVVAEQIRKLAEGSAQASAEIQKTVDGIRKQTEQSVSDAKEARHMVELQTEAVNDIQTALGQVQNYMGNVIAEMKHITRNTEKADVERGATLQAIENISAVIHQTASAAAIVNETAEKLLSHVEELKATAGTLGENMEGLKSGIQSFKTEK